ncbi:MAG: response regulator [Okeania sp. SIO2G4]|uniref:response regulator n=1 Tax=unclassified Okeania TaxID=2634635 RepID=UPI0013BD0376|nr:MULTISPECIES: response regulator [unclassified Okeania]NEP38508.1 response regulator [Okeania sp. SIO2H7]NEP74764.1 response regulator [Okeania sp. SIO2G5]NEP95789.1 response regulator [Okeania sp. SIO2F5]NEQ93567.1 response regulator [Okeania sp. SIO2G4]
MKSNENRKNQLFNLLLNEVPDQFTGKLEVKGSQKSWIIFFCVGRLVWATGGEHPNRRFHRIWHQFCPNISLANMKLREHNDLNYYYYHLLSILSRKKVLIPNQVKAVIIENIKEVVFDILQQQSQELLAYNLSPKGLEKSLILMSVIIPPEAIIPTLHKSFLAWQQSNLTEYSPNLVPEIIKQKLLQQIAKPNSYQIITKLVDGQRTLREIAILMNKDVRQLTLFLMPYVRNELIILKSVPDKQRIEGSPGLQPNVNKKKAPAKVQELIICVDDSKQICYMLEKILKKADYRFIGIQDSIKALPIIIENKPDLIFLDLMMPIANGYEICTQLRRVPIFENIPIIIITGNDGVVDRVRAKMVGATGYITKPLQPKKILAVVKRYLQNYPPKSPEKSDQTSL